MVEASRHADMFSSARGATSLVDLPPEFNEYFGSMINMDDPRHARLRRIVSRAFTPKMIKKFEDDVQRAAAVIVDELLATGPCDFVSQVSARLPLKIICDMMGIGDKHYEMVLRNTNMILAGGDPEFLSDNMDDAIGQILTAGADLAGLVTSLGAERAGQPGDDLISALATANVDGEQLDPGRTGLVLHPAGRRGQRDHPHRALARAGAADRASRTSGNCCWPTSRTGSPAAVEEIVRYVSPVIWMRRSVTRDAVINGHQFREGDKVRADVLVGQPGRVGLRDP